MTFRTGTKYYLWSSKSLHCLMIQCRAAAKSPFWSKTKKIKLFMKMSHYKHFPQGWHLIKASTCKRSTTALVLHQLVALPSSSWYWEFSYFKTWRDEIKMKTCREKTSFLGPHWCSGGTQKMHRLGFHHKGLRTAIVNWEYTYKRSNSKF